MAKQAPAGAGRNAGRGLSLGRKQRLEAAVNSVPQLEFNYEGVCVIENVTAQQITGLRVLAERHDCKSGESPVWTLPEQISVGQSVTVVHNRRNRIYRERLEEKARQRHKIELVGFIEFHRGFAQVTAESEDHAEGIKMLCEKQGWNLYPRGNNVFHIAKQIKRAS